jgi:hypothetical protein
MSSVTKSEIVLKQRRYAATINGQPYYNIEVSAEPGATPVSSDRPMDSHVFIMTIGTTSSEDSFARVATIADMDLVPTFRDFSVSRGQTEYRTANTTLRFVDLDTAIAAIPVLRDRVNNLVDVYTTAVRDFLTPTLPGSNFPSEFSLPMGATILSVKQGLIDSYTKARDSRAAVDSDVAIVQSDYDSNLLSFECEAQKSAIHCDYSSQFVDIHTQLTPLVNQLSAATLALEKAAANASRSRVFKFSSQEAKASDPNLVDPSWSSATSVTYSLPANSGVTLGDLIEVSASGSVQIRTIVGTAAPGLEVAPALDGIPNNVSPHFKVYSILGAFNFSDYGSTAQAAAETRAAYTKFVSETFVSVGSKKQASETECTTSKQASETAWGTAETSKALVQAKDAELTKAQRVETEATAELIAYCPTLDISSL